MDYTDQWRDKISLMVTDILDQYGPKTRVRVIYDFKDKSTGATLHTGLLTISPFSNVTQMENVYRTTVNDLLRVASSLDPDVVELKLSTDYNHSL